MLLEKTGEPGAVFLFILHLDLFVDVRILYCLAFADTGGCVSKHFLYTLLLTD